LVMATYPSGRLRHEVVRSRLRELSLVMA
jgi:hypothetical protein